MGVGDPTELDPWLVYERIVAAIQAATSLRATDELLGDRTTPAPLLHRHFRLDPRGLTFAGRARPGDSVQVTEQVVIVLSHDITTGNAREAYQLASADWVALLRAVLTRTELSGLGQPIAGSLVRRKVGHVLEQQLALNVQYSITLPEAE